MKHREIILTIGFLAVFGFLNWSSVIVADFPSGTLTISPPLRGNVWKSEVNLGEPFTITITAQDDQGVQRVYLWYQGAWHSQDCNKQTSCTQEFNVTEQKAGTYSYFGYIVGTSLGGGSQGAWTKPVYVTGKVKIPTTTTEGIKDLSKYSNKEAFLVSDENWRLILPLIPVAIWSNKDGSITKYPILIYHKENNNFDIDSIYHFFEQYNINKISYFGEIPDELKLLLQKIGRLQQKNDNDIFDYWQNYSEIVYVENDYEKALIASTYASLMNVPLVIQYTNADRNEIFANKRIICVGEVNKNCNEKYGLEELQRKYIEKTKTDKFILVNPNDLNIKISEKFIPERSNSPIFEIYTKNSLAAPILASGKQELIITTNSDNYRRVDQLIEDKINNLNINPKYLTIIGSPNAIPNYKENIINLPQFSVQYPDSEVEYIYYSDVDGDELPDLATGRIYGISSSDVSAYIARDLFFDKLSRSNEYAILSEPSGLGMAVDAISLNEYLRNSLNGFAKINDQILAINNEYIKNNLASKSIISTHSHGNTNVAIVQTYYLKNVYFSPSIYVANACLTCSFQKASPKGELLCANLLRKGIMGVVGAVDAATEGASKFIYYVGRNQDIGTAMKNLKLDQYLKTILIDKERMESNKYLAGVHENLKGNYVLLGDPTLNFGFNIPSRPNGVTVDIKNITGDKKKLTIHVPKPTKYYEEIWNGEYQKYWILPYFDNVINPPYVNVSGDSSYYQSVGNLIFDIPSSLLEYTPIKVTFINEDGERENFNYVEDDLKYKKTWVSSNNVWHYLQLGLRNNKLVMFFYDGEQRNDNQPILRDRTYEIILGAKAENSSTRY
jgi:hypothetical protein